MPSFKEKQGTPGLVTSFTSLFNTKIITHNTHRRITQTEIYAAGILRQARRRKQAKSVVTDLD